MEVPTPSKPAGNSEWKGESNNHNKRKLDPKEEDDQLSREANKPNSNGKVTVRLANNCGWSNHLKADCIVKTHKFANPDTNKC